MGLQIYERVLQGAIVQDSLPEQKGCEWALILTIFESGASRECKINPIYCMSF